MFRILLRGFDFENIVHILKRHKGGNVKFVRYVLTFEVKVDAEV